MTCYFCGSFIISHFSFKIICLVLLYVPLCSSVCIGRKFLCVVSMALSTLLPPIPRELDPRDFCMHELAT